MRSVRSLLAITLAVGLLAGACSKGGDGSAEGTTPPSPTATAASPTSVPSPTTTASPTSGSPTAGLSPSETPILEDGRHFGYIRSIDVASETLVFDLAYFLTGDEANQAAAEQGDETPVPNDYYIVNDNPKLRTLPVAPSVEVLVIDWGNCCDLVQGEVQPFADAFATKHHKWNAMYRGAESQYWLTVENGVVTKIEEQYLP